MKDVKFLAIFVGVVVDVLGSLLIGIMICVCLFLFHLAAGMPLKEILLTMDAKHLNENVPVQLASVGGGGFCSLAGGFVTGWMAKQFRLKNGLLMGVASTLLSVFFWGFNPAWYNAVCVVFTIGPATIGGFYSQAVLGIGL